MDDGISVLSVECTEPEGTFNRHIRPARLTTSVLQGYWERLKEFDVLFNDEVRQDLDSFIGIFLSGDLNDEIVANGLVWEVDDVGIIFVTDITPSAAKGHFSFWDRRVKGREVLIRQMTKWLFNQFGFHRITCEVPLYAAAWLSRTVEKAGFKKEGRLREVVRYKGQWFDVNLYSMLNHEVD